MNRMVLMIGTALAAVSCLVADQTKDSGTTFAKDALQPMVDKGSLGGAVNVFYSKGRQEVACLGFADPDTRRKITMDDVFMQCSQTKGFCGVTVAKLVEQGKLGLDDPVAKYLPEFNELWIELPRTNDMRRLVKAKNVLTVRMVMNHTGGFPFELPNCVEMGGWSRRMPLRSVAATAASQPIAFEPGTKASYSNVGIDIGAAVVEKVTGMRWEKFLQKTVLDPLGMKSSSFWPTDRQLATKMEIQCPIPGKRPAKVYEREWMQHPYNDDRVFASAGAGLWTTARDQLKFYKMLMNLGLGENGVRILKEETVKSILAVSTRPKGFGGYSLGLSAPETDSETAWFGHGGAWGTNCSVNWHTKELSLWAVQNGQTAEVGPLREKAEKAFFKYALDNAGVGSYTGRVTK